MADEHTEADYAAILDAALEKHISKPEAVKKFAPARLREAATALAVPAVVVDVTPAPAPARMHVPITPLQRIGDLITKLTWREAEAMAKAIQAKMTKGEPGELTSALQAWAWEWETYQEDDRPRKEDF